MPHVKLDPQIVMPRRQRRRVAYAQPHGNNIHLEDRPSVPSLPVELFAKIIGYLFGGSGAVFYESPPVSAPALANVARVSRLFYELAMPLLWREVHLWRPQKANPSTLLKYPREPSKRVFRFIRMLHLSSSCEIENMNKTKLNKQSRYLSKCLKFLKNATHVKSLHLFIHLYNINDNPPEFRLKLEGINSIIFSILRHAANMELDEFAFNPSNETVRSSNALSIVERKLTRMRIMYLRCGTWVERLHYQERLTYIEVHVSSFEPIIDPSEFDRNFWTAIAQLDHCKKANVTGIPIPFNGNIKFRNLTDLDLLFSFLREDLEPSEWANTFAVVFQYMPRLEHLFISSRSGPGFQKAIESLDVSNVACKDLKILNLTGYFPLKLLITILSQCSKLTSCRFGLQDIDDEHLRALSQCQRLTSLSLDSPNQKINKGLAYLTNLPRLAMLDIHYSIGKCIDVQLLYDLARHCPHLNVIRTNDRSSNRGEFHPRPFATEDIAELFAAGAELRAYFEPKYREPSGWDIQTDPARLLAEYLIHINHLRRDKSLF